MYNKKTIKVLIIDDQAVVREVLDRGLSMDPEIKVVGRASDAFIARDKIVRLSPDVLTLDVEMPRMNGVEFMRKLMPQHPLPVVVVSSLTKNGKLLTIEMLEAGAVEIVLKPDGSVGGLESMLAELTEKVKIAAKTDVSKWLKIKEAETFRKIKREQTAINGRPLSLPFRVREPNLAMIAIGASTGGTIAIREIFGQLPPDIPGILVVQHMPAGFTALFAESMNAQYEFDVKEAEDGDRIIPGRALIAPGDLQMSVEKYGRQYKVNIFPGKKVSGHRPSVDVLFDSIVECGAGPQAIGIILTGMGRDGANGLLRMHKSGSWTIAQDESTAMIYGMPRVAVELGAVNVEVPLHGIGDKIIKLVYK